MMYSQVLDKKTGERNVVIYIQPLDNLRKNNFLEKMACCIVELR